MIRSLLSEKKQAILFFFPQQNNQNCFIWQISCGAPSSLLLDPFWLVNQPQNEFSRTVERAQNYCTRDVPHISPLPSPSRQQVIGSCGFFPFFHSSIPQF